MDVKEAVRTAKEYVADLYSDEPARHIGVEEVIFDEPKNAWKVTIGFFRPWDEKLGLSGILGTAAEGETALWKRRSFKVVQVDDGTGEVKSLTHRTLSSLN
ncbi:MAG: hypothetical protein OXH76_23270 [Boseongicola sp.]|nr:hypothetical protein [Boseongicola sp.]